MVSLYNYKIIFIYLIILEKVTLPLIYVYLF